MTEVNKTTVAVFVFVKNGDSILLVKQNYGQQIWSLPGGVMEADESIDQAAMREVKEETGLDICLRRLVNEFVAFFHHRVYNLGNFYPTQIYPAH